MPQRRTTTWNKETRNDERQKGMAATLLALATLAVVAAAPAVSRAQGAGVDPEAVKLLRRMTDYLGSLKQFSVHTQTILEDVLASGHRVDFDVSANVIISRPNKLRAERKGDLIDQISTTMARL